MSNYYTIVSSELELFASACAKHGLKPDDFTIKEHDITYCPLGNGLNHPNGKITISKGNQSVTLDTGKGKNWVEAFQQALKDGSL